MLDNINKIIRNRFIIKSGFLNRYEAIKKNPFLSRNEIEEISFNKLRKLLIHCCIYVPYYSKTMKEIGFNPYNFNLNDFKKLPVVNKKIIQANPSDFIDYRYRKCFRNAKSYKNMNFFEILFFILSLNQRIFLDSTTGSTGKPLYFLQNKHSYVNLLLGILRSWKYMGYKKSNKLLLIWQEDLQMHKTSLFLKIMYSMANIEVINFTEFSRKKTKIIITKIKKIRPVYIIGFPSIIYWIGQYILENKEKKLPRIKSIQLIGEQVFYFQKALIEKAFGSKVFFTYGSRELGHIALEDNCHKGLHINEDMVHLELNSKREIIITNFQNFIMPFIRYNTEDIALSKVFFSEHKCKNNFKMIKNVIGRKYDHIATPNNRKIHAFYFLRVLSNKKILQFQLIQRRKDLIDVILYSKQNIEKEIKIIKTKLRKFLGRSIKINIKKLDAPIKSKNKFKYVISNID